MISKVSFYVFYQCICRHINHVVAIWLCVTYLTLPQNRMCIHHQNSFIEFPRFKKSGVNVVAVQTHVRIMENGYKKINQLFYHHYVCTSDGNAYPQFVGKILGSKRTRQYSEIRILYSLIIE